MTMTMYWMTFCLTAVIVTAREVSVEACVVLYRRCRYL